MYESTREFVEALEKSGELLRIRGRVSPVLEVATIADRVSRLHAPSLGSESSRRNDPRFAYLGGPALLFEDVAGSSVPLLINAWGSYRRMEMALGCHSAGHTPGGFDALAARIGSLVKPQPPSSLAEVVAKAREFLPLLRIPPKRRRGTGPCQEVVETGPAIDLTTLPIIRCWPLDGDFSAVGYPAGVNDAVAGIERSDDWNRDYRGRYITLAGIHTVHADDAEAARPPSHNIGMYRVQLLARDRVAMHWHMHHDGARHWRSWKKRGRRMPVAIVLGGESVMPYAATAPLPPGISELLLAGFLNRGGIPMVRGATVPLWVPANAEIVIEGYVSEEAGGIGFDPRSGEPLGPGAVFEGPFGDHTGFYSMPDRYPIVEVTAVTRRANAIYPTTIVGLPPQEDYYLGKATERLFFPLLKTIVHDVEDYDLPMFGAFHNCAFLQVNKAYPLQGRRLMHSIWGAGQMAWTKTIFVVDDDCDVHDTHAVLSAAARFCHPRRDIERVNGPLDILDHAAPRLGAGTKLGFDCTRKIAGEEVGGLGCSPTPRSAATDTAAAGYLRAILSLPGVVGASLPAELDRGWLFIAIAKRGPREGDEVIRRVLALGDGGAGLTDEQLPPFVVVLDETVDLADIDRALFCWCAHTDAGRDATLGGSPDRPRLAFDATPKVSGDERNGEPVRPWPPMLSVDADMRQRVDSRWEELGLPAITR